MALQSQDREKIQLALNTEAKERLIRYCKFMGLSMTRFIEKRAAYHDEKALARLSADQRQAYLDGRLHWDDLTIEEQHVFTAPLPKRRQANGAVRLS